MNAGGRAAESVAPGTPGRIAGTVHSAAVRVRGLGAAVASRRWLLERERGWRLLCAGRRPSAGGPARRAAYPENGKGFGMEKLAAGEDGPGAVTGAGPWVGVPS